MRHRKPEAKQSELREDTKGYVDSIVKQLSEDELSKISVGAHAIKEGLGKLAAEGTDEEKAARFALSIASLLALMARTDVGSMGDVLDHSIAGYAMAAGALLDVYELPEVPEGDDTAALIEQIKADLDEHKDETAVKYL